MTGDAVDLRVQRDLGEILSESLRLYRGHAPILTFGGGTNEVQREIIAMAGLAMPRSR